MPPFITSHSSVKAMPVTTMTVNSASKCRNCKGGHGRRNSNEHTCGGGGGAPRESATHAQLVQQQHGQTGGGRHRRQGLLRLGDGTLEAVHQGQGRCGGVRHHRGRARSLLMVGHRCGAGGGKERGLGARNKVSSHARMAAAAAAHSCTRGMKSTLGKAQRTRVQERRARLAQGGDQRRRSQRARSGPQQHGAAQHGGDVRARGDYNPKVGSGHTPRRERHDGCAAAGQ